MRARPMLTSRVASAAATQAARGHEVMADQLEKQAALAKGTARTLQQLNAKVSSRHFGVRAHHLLGLKHVPLAEPGAQVRGWTAMLMACLQGHRTRLHGVHMDTPDGPVQQCFLRHAAGCASRQVDNLELVVEGQRAALLEEQAGERIIVRQLNSKVGGPNRRPFDCLRSPACTSPPCVQSFGLV